MSRYVTPFLIAQHLAETQEEARTRRRQSTVKLINPKFVLVAELKVLQLKKKKKAKKSLISVMWTNDNKKNTQGVCEKVQHIFFYKVDIIVAASMLFMSNAIFMQSIIYFLPFAAELVKPRNSQGIVLWLMQGKTKLETLLSVVDSALLHTVCVWPCDATFPPVVVLLYCNSVEMNTIQICFVFVGALGGTEVICQLNKLIKCHAL